MKALPHISTFKRAQTVETENRDCPKRENLALELYWNSITGTEFQCIPVYSVDTQNTYKTICVGVGRTSPETDKGQLEGFW